MASASGCFEYCSRLATSERTWVASKSGAVKLIDELRLAVGERARFVEDHRAAVGDLLEDGGVADDDRALGGERDRADDRDGNRDQQRARRGDDHHGEEADGVAADEPGGETEGDGDRRVDRTELIAEAAELGCCSWEDCMTSMILA